MVVFVVAMGVTFVATPLVRTIAARLGAVDVPDDRKVHTTPTPTLGGLAIFAGVVAGLATALLIADFRELFQTSSEPVGVLAAAVAMVGLGALDDVRNLRASTKLAGQVIATGALILAGVQVFYFWLPGAGLISLSPDMSALLTVVWTVLLVNAVNLIDGLDGLAAGVVLTVLGGFGLLAAPDGVDPTLYIIAATMGAAVGFLAYNLHPATIIMGDTGSMVLGFVVAAVAISLTQDGVYPHAPWVPIVALGVPLLDTAWAVVRRTARGEAVFVADRGHIHHQLLRLGFSQRDAMLSLTAVSAGLAVVAVLLGRLD
jgi:UDP-GlcNAc:undecaprenyl-phosphate GlcNAc-1-phosphate transferase